MALLDTFSMDTLISLEVLLRGETIILQGQRFQMQVVNGAKRFGVLWGDGRDRDRWYPLPTMTVDAFCERVQTANQTEIAVIHTQHEHLRLEVFNGPSTTP
jgi:hypothetical protein